jgi:hypothetical protein
MKRFLLAVLCCAVFSGCKEKKPVLEHQHTASCNHLESSVIQKAPEKIGPMSELSEEQLQVLIQKAETGDMILSYMLHEYYEDRQDQKESQRWLDKTIRILENTPADDVKANRMRSRLGLTNEDNRGLVEHVVPGGVPDPPAEPNVPSKRAAPRI